MKGILLKSGSSWKSRHPKNYLTCQEGTTAIVCLPSSWSPHTFSARFKAGSTPGPVGYFAYHCWLSQVPAL